MNNRKAGVGHSWRELLKFLHRKGLSQVLAFGLLVLISCSPSINLYYPGHFFSADNVYRNNSLRFAMTFMGNWDIYTDPDQMSRSNRSYARELHQNGLELLFVGSTAEGFHGTRAIAGNLNKSALEYAYNIQELNSEFVDKDLGLEDLTEKMELIRWTYERSGFRFTEYFFTLGTYNLRLAFWAAPDHFERFLVVYDDIVGSIVRF
ncbi:hypothetical protein CHISP_1992 [Chitinispirillum alkaliphilum]|nr:hypothetical protein CHISP_1992 [Chitinispirillum alkaliphilum]